MSRIVSFYSYKGGVGRTFVMANIAVLLARRRLRVLMMDWDLEAPGLDRFFKKWIPDPPLEGKGVLPMLLAASKDPSAGWRDHVSTVSGLKEGATLSVIPSGAAFGDYASWLHSFSWDRFFREQQGGAILDRWREEWKQAYDFILVDSRTGLSDIGGICTIFLPDFLAVVFTASHQSAHGARAVIDSAQRARQELDVTRLPLSILPIPARFDGREEVDLGEKWLNEFAELFGPVMDSWLPSSISPRDILVKLKVPYVARFSFGEELAVETHGTADPDFPGYSIAASAQLLASSFKDAEAIVHSNGSMEQTSPGKVVEGFIVNGSLDLAKLERHLHSLEDSAGRGPEVADLLHEAGVRLLKEARHAEAEPLMRRALAIDEAGFDKDHPRVAVGLNNLAQVFRSIHRHAEAEPLMRRALAIDEAGFGTDHSNVARDLNNLALLLTDTGRLAEAEPLMRRALAIAEASFGKDHTVIAIRLNNLAHLLQDTNRVTEAEPLMRRALAIDEAAYGKDHPYVARNLNNLAQLLQATNRHAEAESLMRRALAIDEASLGKDHPNVAIRLNNLAMLLQATNRHAEAEPLLRRAVAIDEASLGKDHPKVGTGLNNLALLFMAADRVTEAEPLMRRALAIDEAAYGKDHPNVAIRLSNLAQLLKATDRLEEAEPLLLHAVEIFAAFRERAGNEHPHWRTVIGNYRALLQAMGRTPEEVEAKLQEILPG